MLGAHLAFGVGQGFAAHLAHAFLHQLAVPGGDAEVGREEAEEACVEVGVIAGLGGSQRLPRYVGKAKAMDMHLTGRFMDAAEAERCGLVSRVVPVKKLKEEALAAAVKITEKSLLAAAAAKEAVNAAFETSLAEGLRVERALFYALFATEDQKEGMAAFLEKREAQFRDR